ncbi:hypothetical protein HD554DRAFT_2128199 [Boletus coccyginus]|nr:hypothetical protein HD554DRAFT_2128199 [Boletus coccyginus]
MADDAIGTCCALWMTACIDVLAGICIDIVSVRRSCTETLCRCSAIIAYPSAASTTSPNAQQFERFVIARINIPLILIIPARSSILSICPVYIVPDSVHYMYRRFCFTLVNAFDSPFCQPLTPINPSRMPVTRRG